jgi:hypothetical protein
VQCGRAAWDWAVAIVLSRSFETLVGGDKQLVCCISYLVFCMLYVAGCRLHTARCIMHVVCCMLYVACCTLCCMLSGVMHDACDMRRALCYRCLAIAAKARHSGASQGTALSVANAEYDIVSRSADRL